MTEEPIVPSLGPLRLVLWRHGQTDYNVSGRFQGQSDSVLTATGQAQAAAAAAAIRAQLRLEHARIASSDLVRARDTAAALAGLLGVDVEADADLRELSYGDWEGLTRADVARRWPEDFAAWEAGDDDASHGGESREASGRRVAAAIRRHARQARDEGTGALVVVAHAGVLRAAAAELLELPDPARLGVLGNAAWGALEERRSDGAWMLRSWNCRA
ncbi:histidine phosphatase family protein [Sediminivirga luteola]|uniref:histidine phosphatase family protein n=1 Tax=Sediminivirga luteola TaxID=1774748 RepID=UPI00166C667D|nr:histidine phosphatase family protein [Sediminivirga luteola]